jgi:hypothetical protein
VANSIMLALMIAISLFGVRRELFPRGEPKPQLKHV